MPIVNINVSHHIEHLGFFSNKSFELNNIVEVDRNIFFKLVESLNFSFL